MRAAWQRDAPTAPTLAPAAAAALIVVPVAKPKKITDALLLSPRPPLPFCLTHNEVKLVIQRANNLRALGMLPSEIASTQLHLIFKTPGWLKMHDWILIIGPVMKYLLRGLLAPPQRGALFRYIDVLSRSWRRSITVECQQGLIRDAKIALADMEFFFPAWHLNINRHIVLHIIERFGFSGPGWLFTTFPYERMWKRYVTMVRRR